MPAKHAMFNTRITTEEEAMIELLRRRLGIKTKGGILAFLVAEKYHKLYGDYDPIPKIRFILNQEAEKREMAQERERARTQPRPPRIRHEDLAVTPIELDDDFPDEEPEDLDDD